MCTTEQNTPKHSQVDQVKQRRSDRNVAETLNHSHVKTYFLISTEHNYCFCCSSYLLAHCGYQSMLQDINKLY